MLFFIELLRYVVWIFHILFLRTVSDLPAQLKTLPKNTTNALLDQTDSKKAGIPKADPQHISALSL